MSENGSPNNRSTIWKQVASQLSDHVELASLELRYEGERALKKLLVAGAMMVLVMTGFIVLQVSLVGWLMKVGLSLGASALILSGVYFVLAYVIFTVSRRDRRVGPPFAGTQKELQATIQWIQKILS